MFPILLEEKSNYFNVNEEFLESLKEKINIVKQQIENEIIELDEKDEKKLPENLNNYKKMIENNISLLKNHIVNECEKEILDFTNWLNQLKISKQKELDFKRQKSLEELSNKIFNIYELPLSVIELPKEISGYSNIDFKNLINSKIKNKRDLDFEKIMNEIDSDLQLFISKREVIFNRYKYYLNNVLDVYGSKYIRFFNQDMNSKENLDLVLKEIEKEIQIEENRKEQQLKIKEKVIEKKPINVKTEVKIDKPSIIITLEISKYNSVLHADKIIELLENDYDILNVDVNTKTIFLGEK